MDVLGRSWNFLNEIKGFENAKFTRVKLTRTDISREKTYLRLLIRSSSQKVAKLGRIMGVSSGRKKSQRSLFSGIVARL